MQICPACGVGIDGKDVQWGPFKNHPILQELDISKMCAGCVAAIPPEIMKDILARPAFFVENHRKKLRGLIRPSNKLHFASDADRTQLPSLAPGMDIGVPTGVRDPRIIA